MRVANLDMTDPDQKCPCRWFQTSEQDNTTTAYLRQTWTSRIVCLLPIQLKGLLEFVGARVIGYQGDTPDAFELHFLNRTEDVYVDGVSLTHGQPPHQHIWTFINALYETRSDIYVCPCTRPDLNYTGVVTSLHR